MADFHNSITAFFLGMNCIGLHAERCKGLHTKKLLQEFLINNDAEEVELLIWIRGDFADIFLDEKGSKLYIGSSEIMNL